jgi:hypothetical protein
MRALHQRVIGITGLLISCLCTHVLSQSLASPVVFAETGTLELNAKVDGTVPIKVQLNNLTPKRISLHFGADLHDQEEHSVLLDTVERKALSIEPYGTGLFDISIKLRTEQVPLRGVIYLLPQDESGKPLGIVSRNVTISKTRVRQYSALVLVISLFSSLAVVFLGLIKTKFLDRNKLNLPIGQANFEMSTSWGTTLSLGASLLTGFASITNLQDSTATSSRTEIVSLATWFGALVLVAPFIFRAFSKAKPLLPDLKLDYVSKAWVFVAMSALALWGVLGQFATLALFFSEISTRHAVGLAYVGLFSVLALATLVALLFHSYRTISTTLLLVEASNASNKTKSFLGELNAPPKVVSWPML